MLRCGSVSLHEWGLSVFPKTTVSTLLSVIIITGRLSHTPSLWVLDVDINGITVITTHITESKIHISYSETHDSTLFLHYFYMSSLPTLAHTIVKGSIFRSVVLPRLQNYKKIVLLSHRLSAFRSQCQWTRIFISLTIPIGMGTQLGLKRLWESLFISVSPKTMVSAHISEYFDRSPFLYGCMMHKQHHSYHWVKDLKNLDSTLMLASYYFYISPFFIYHW